MMKQRRQFFRKLGGFTALLALPFSAKPNVASKEEFLHVVYFWLKNQEPETTEKFLSELRKFIDNMDLIRTRHIGSPADTDREVIDNTWSYSLILSFDSKKEHDLYQDHPLHKKFIKNASSLWEKVQVYDSVKLI